MLYVVGIESNQPFIDDRKEAINMGLIHELAIAKEQGGKKACMKAYNKVAKAERKEAAKVSYVKFKS